MFEEHLGAGRRRERGYLLKKMAATVKSFRRFPFRRPRRFGLLPGGGSAPIGCLFDGNGLPHSWTNLGAPRGPEPQPPTIYLYENGAAGAAEEPPLERTRAQLVRELAAAYAAGGPNPVAGRRCTDQRCGACGVLRSEAAALSREEVESARQDRVAFEAFFRCYETRCPGGEEAVHLFAPDGPGAVCGQCGLQRALVYGHSEAAHVAAAREYYVRWRGRYLAERARTTSAGGLLASGAGRPPPHPAEAEEARAFAESFEPRFETLTRAAELAGVPVPVFVALGSTERRVYQDVLDGVGAPPPPTQHDDPRLLGADADVRLFITAFNRLRFVTRLSAPGAVEARLVAVGAPPDQWAALPEMLPDVAENYVRRRMAVQRVRPPALELDYILYALAEMIIRIAEASREGAPWLNALGRAFVRDEVGAIVRSERLLAKHGAFAFSVFGGKDGEDLDPQGTLCAPDEPVGEVGEDLEVPGPRPFSLEGADLGPPAFPNLEGNPP